MTKNVIRQKLSLFIAKKDDQNLLVEKTERFPPGGLNFSYRYFYCFYNMLQKKEKKKRRVSMQTGMANAIEGAVSGNAINKNRHHNIYRQ